MTCVRKCVSNAHCITATCIYWLVNYILILEEILSMVVVDNVVSFSLEKK